jgi:hypothetical protein
MDMYAVVLAWRLTNYANGCACMVQAGVPDGTPKVSPLILPSRPRRNRRSDTVRCAPALHRCSPIIAVG